LAVSRCPNLVKAYLFMSSCFLRKGDADKACDYWIHALELGPYFLRVFDNSERLKFFKPEIVYLREGLQSLQEGNFKSAFRNFNVFLSQNPNFALGNYYLGVTLYNMALFTQAQKRLQNAIELKPNFVKGYIERGKILLRKNDIERASLDFNRAVLLNPDLSESYYWLAFVFYEKNDLNRSKQLYNKTLRMFPLYAKIYLRLSKIYYEEGAFKKANKAKALYKKIKAGLFSAFFYQFDACPDSYRYLSLPKNISEKIYFENFINDLPPRKWTQRRENGRIAMISKEVSDGAEEDRTV